MQGDATSLKVVRLPAELNLGIAVGEILDQEAVDNDKLPD
jgi:hypothetical protein